MLTETTGRDKINEAPVYYSQRDNSIDPHSTCFPTSMAMAYHNLELLKDNPRPFIVNSYGGFDEYIIQDIKSKLPTYLKAFEKLMGFVPKGKDHIRYYWLWQKNYGEKVIGGFKLDYVRKPTPERIRAALDQGFLVVCGTKLTKSGHVVLINGYHLFHAGFYMSDPYGQHPYKGKNINRGEGAFVHDYWWLGNSALIVSND